MAAPYRLPVWRHLARDYALTVALLESNDGLKRDTHANRGSDWLHHDSDEVNFQELPTWKIRRGESRYYVLKSLHSLLVGRKFDVIIFGGWESPAYWSLLVSSFIFGTARVGFYESPLNTMTHKSGPIAWMRSRFFRSMQAVVVPGEAAARAMCSIGVSKKLILQGFNAVDVTKFYSATTTQPKSAVKPDPGHRYLYVGRLIALKRVEAIIEAFANMASSSDKLSIVGAGALRDDLRELAMKRAVNVQFIEHVENDHVPRIMAEHHTLVLASEREVWGLVVNEGLAAGMHVVVTDNCGVVPSVLGMRGVHVAKADLSDLAQQMKVSKTNWSGRVDLPEILAHTPERFAGIFASAIAMSLQKGRTNGRPRSRKVAG